MRRVVWCAAVLSLSCGSAGKNEPRAGENTVKTGTESQEIGSGEGAAPVDLKPESLAATSPEGEYSATLEESEGSDGPSDHAVGETKSYAAPDTEQPAEPPAPPPKAMAERDHVGDEIRGGFGGGGKPKKNGGGRIDRKEDPSTPAGAPGGGGGSTFSAPVARPVAAPAMKAGRHDDNKQYNRFVQFLEENGGYVVYPVDVAERLVIETVDQNGKSLANCDVQVQSLAGKTLSATTSYADGRTHFFPKDAAPAADKDFTVKATCNGKVRNGQLSRAGRRENQVKFPFARTVPARVPVDIAIVFDTTGSMGSQIDRLKQTLQAIHFQLSQAPTKPDIRFGLVAYRDRGDTYLTQVTGFTGDLDSFQRTVDGLDADGGGDTPEDLQEAFDKALHELNWRKDGIRLGFVIADAIPHTDYGQSFNYREAMRESLRRGIKWTMVGAGGLPRAGEVIFRQVAQFSMGEYVFVTQSAAGDREGGVGEASHHVGTNYTSENLDQAIIRIVRRELSYLTDDPKEFDYTIVATGTDKTPRADVLAPAVQEVLRQLHDYASLKIAPGTPVAIVPVTAEQAAYKDVAGYLSDELALAASRNPSFKVVERDLQALANEVKVQLSDLFDVTETVPIGKLMGAELLIVAKLTVRGDKAELFAKLVRVETGEMLSVARATLSGAVLGSS